jgi:hypothetical protein
VSVSRSVKALVVAAAAANALVASQAAFANTYGTRIYNVAREYGSISSIRVPNASTQPADPNGFYLHRVTDQSGFATDGTEGLLQAGWISAGTATTFDTCGNTASSTHDYVEWKVAGTSSSPANYNCHVYTQQSAGTTWNFNVYVNSTGWNAKINGNVDPDGPWTLDFGDGYAAAGSEAGTNVGQAGACYGTGASDWEYYSAPTDGGSGDTPVSNNADTILGTPQGDWGVGAAPTPFGTGLHVQVNC